MSFLEILFWQQHLRLFALRDVSQELRQKKWELSEKIPIEPNSIVRFVKNYPSMPEFIKSKTSDIDGDLSGAEFSNATNNRTTLLLVHAHWCGRSKKFMKKWEEVKKLLSTSPVNVKRIDGASNDTPGFSFYYFPVVLWLPGGMVYQGKHQSKDIAQWAIERLREE